LPKRLREGRSVKELSLFAQPPTKNAITYQFHLPEAKGYPCEQDAIDIGGKMTDNFRRRATLFLWFFTCVLSWSSVFAASGTLQLFTKPNAPGPDNMVLGAYETTFTGASFVIYAHVFDSLYNWIPANDNLVTWTMTDTMGNPLLTTTAGASTGFTPREAYGNVTITATFKDPSNPTEILTTKISVYIGPGQGTHIVIEADSLARKTRNDRPTTISVDRTTNVMVYAVVRDTFGNFVRFANNATWATAAPTTATATPLATRQWAASVAEKSFGSTTLTATETGLTPGTATIACTGISGPVPVMATLLDTNGNGHLDKIDIVAPDSVSLVAALPTVQQWILSMNIISDDGGAKVTLTAASMTSDGGRTIHIVLQENSGSTLETGWTSATIALSDLPLTTDGRSLYIEAIIDGVEPVVKSVCYISMPAADTLRVIFSEPVYNVTKPIDEYSLLSIVHKNGSMVPISAGAVIVVKFIDRFLYVFPSHTLSGQDRVTVGSLSFSLGLCSDIGKQENPFHNSSKEQEISITQTSSAVFFSLSGKTSSVSIYDIHGRLVASLPVKGTVAVLHGTNAAKGRYFVQVSGDTQKVVKSFMLVQ
jgi:hypothetical protein